MDIKMFYLGHCEQMQRRRRQQQQQQEAEQSREVSMEPLLL